MEELYQQALNDPKRLDPERANDVFQDIKNIMEEAESRCRKFKMGTIEFSEESQKAMLAVRY